MTYPEHRLVEELTVLALHFHWPLSELLDLEHPLRERFLDELERLVGSQPRGA